MKSRIIVGTKLSCNVTTPLFILTKPATHPSLCRWHTYNYTLYIHTQPSKQRFSCELLLWDKNPWQKQASMSEKLLKWAKMTLTYKQIQGKSKHFNVREREASLG